MIQVASQRKWIVLNKQELHVLKDYRKMKRVDATYFSEVYTGSNNGEKYIPVNVTPGQSDLWTNSGPASHGEMGNMANTVLIGEYFFAIRWQTKKILK